MPTIQADVSLDSHPAQTPADVFETCRRVGLILLLDEEIEPIDADAGVWLLPVTPVVLHRLNVDGEIAYCDPTSSVRAEMS